MSQNQKESDVFDQSAYPSLYKNNFKNVISSFLCGCLGGVANILSSHPFDTIKVRMQILDMKLFDSLKYIIKTEGTLSLYKGMGSPLMSVPVIYAFCFGAYEIGKWLQGIKPKEDVTVSQAMIAGVFAGFGISGIVTPMELVKCRMQMEGAGKRMEKSTTLGMVKHVIRTNGIKELYKGNVITLFRELPSGAMYFGGYEYANMKLEEKYGEYNTNSLLAGGTAGFLSYVVGYPQDVVKTKLQCDDGMVRKYHENKYIKDGGIINCAKEIWRIKGIVGFTKGFSACVTRGVIAEAMTFFVYENTKKYVN